MRATNVDICVRAALVSRVSILVSTELCLQCILASLGCAGSSFSHGPLRNPTPTQVKIVSHLSASKVYLDSDVPRERSILQKLSANPGPFLLYLVASWEDSANYYLLTPWAEGPDLTTKMLTSGRFSKEQATLYAVQLIRSVEHLHCQSILHRDIKPSNVFFDPAGNVVLCDLGLAKALEGPESVSFDANPDASSGSFRWDECCATSEPCGTLPFMSPQQHFGRNYSYDVDVWGVGMCLFWMLTARSPFEGNPRTAEEYASVAATNPVMFRGEDNLDEEARDVLLWLLGLTGPRSKDIRSSPQSTGSSSQKARFRHRGSPRLGRPELVIPGAPCDKSTFGFAPQAFVNLAPPSHPVKIWANRIKSLFKTKAKSSLVPVNVPSVIPPRNAPFVTLVVSLVAPVQDTPSVQDKQPRRLLMVIRRRAYPSFDFTGPVPGDDESLPDLKCAPAPSVDQEKVIAIPKVSELQSTASPDFPPNPDSRRAKRLSHTRQHFVLDGQQPPINPRPLGQRLLNCARSAFQVKTTQLVN
ncbi:kinase-like domain-containing protein [Mycena epipterygia]|nr:kinase-like domain-containing protein [Mycena epipterygia]